MLFTFVLHSFDTMIIRTNIMIEDAIKESGQREAKNKKLRGGFSEYVEQLIEQDLKKKKIDILTNLDFEQQST